MHLFEKYFNYCIFLNKFNLFIFYNLKNFFIILINNNYEMYISTKFLYKIINLFLFPLKFISMDYRYNCSENTFYFFNKVLDKYDFFSKKKFKFNRTIYCSLLKKDFDFSKLIATFKKFKISTIDNTEIHKRLVETNDNFNELSIIIKSIIDELIGSKIICGNFQIAFFNINYNLPVKKIIHTEKEIEVFSNAWHYDNYNPRIVNIILYLDDVSEIGGGTEFLEDKKLCMTIKKLKIPRWKRNQFIENSKVKVRKIYGKKGTYCVFSSSKILHRGSIPIDKKRKSLTISLLPSISKFNPSKLNLSKLINSHAFKIFL